MTGPARLPKAPWRILDMSIPEPNSGCWIWLGYIGPNGYGELRADGRTRRAHRISYEIFNGPIPSGLVVRHRCDNPPCVNPDHLVIGSMKDNTQDMLRRGRHHTTPRLGEDHHKAILTEEDVRSIRRSAERHCDLARHYGVDGCTILDIRKGRTWRHVA